MAEACVREVLDGCLAYLRPDWSLTWRLWADREGRELDLVARGYYRAEPEGDEDSFYQGLQGGLVALARDRVFPGKEHGKNQQHSRDWTGEKPDGIQGVLRFSYQVPAAFLHSRVRGHVRLAFDRIFNCSPRQPTGFNDIFSCSRVIRLGIFVFWLLHFLPLPILAPIGKGMGMLLYWLGRERRRVARINLRLCFPEMADTQREQLVRAHFRAFGQSLLDRGILRADGPDDDLAAVEQASTILTLPGATGCGRPRRWCHRGARPGKTRRAWPDPV